jgi:murein DD-endopeptidase MepM/ murein hydrolase activator NlpD
MNIIFVGKFRGKPLRCQLDGPRQLIACSLIISLFAGLLVSSGFWYGKTEAAVNELAALQRDISKQKILINEARQSAESELDALAARIGKMQANVIRLNALGQRLVKVAKLDSKEFNFKDTPSYGGPNESESVASMDFDDVIANLDKQLSTREEQLAVLEEVIMSRQLRSESKPRGRPITKGWTSSYYGKRADPFTGKLAMHKGMDFAGKEGSDIVAKRAGDLADGVNWTFNGAPRSF